MDVIHVVYKNTKYISKYRMHIFQVISSDEKCASAILDFEALMKADQSNPAFQSSDFIPGTAGNVGTEDDFLDNLFQQGFIDGSASADIEGFCFDDSTLDFNDLRHLGFGVSGTSFSEFP